MIFGTSNGSKTIFMNENSNITFDIDGDSVQIIEYENGQPRQAAIIDVNLLSKIMETGLKIGKYNGNC